MNTRKWYLLFACILTIAGIVGIVCCAFMEKHMEAFLIGAVVAYLDSLVFTFLRHN